jgi:hypothetical protein
MDGRQFKKQSYFQQCILTVDTSLVARASFVASRLIRIFHRGERPPRLLVACCLDLRRETQRQEDKSGGRGQRIFLDTDPSTWFDFAHHRSLRACPEPVEGTSLHCFRTVNFLTV